MSSTIVYPLGFLGYDIGLQVKEAGSNLDQIVQAIKFNKPVPKQEATISNHDVEQLWKQYSGGFQFITSFEFREKILLCGLRAFGTENFYDWLKLQEQSPYYTEMHRKFLIDTLNFITTGKRSLPTQTWVTLIQPREVNSQDRQTRVNIDSYFYSPSYGMNEIQPPEGYSPAGQVRPELTDVIWKWVAKDGGFEDLIVSLHIFFGDSLSSNPIPFKQIN